MTMQVSDSVVGRLLDDRYRVGDRIARGGMATVYAGMDTRLDRPVAIKIMHPGYAEDAAFVARFTREARSAARLSHPNVVSVFDQGEDGGTVFLVMEYVAGRTLRDLLQERGRLSPAETIEVMEPVLGALAAAHQAGIVHRDVKPENVLLADDGRVKVADFGLARAASAAGSSQATQGVLIGTVAYLSPEQVERGIADARSDVYSAGIVMYELLTGTPPYAGESPMAVAYAHVHEDVPAPSQTRPGLHPALDALVVKSTRRDPDERPADAGRLLAAVHEVRRLVPVDDLATTTGPVPSRGSVNDTLVVPVATPGGARPSPARGPGAVGPPSEGPPRAARGGGPVRVLIGLLLLLALTVGAGWAAWWYGEGRWVTTPSVLNLSEDEATAKLTEVGLQTAVGEPEFSETVPADQVLRTDPEPTERVREGGTVTLVLSKGPQRFDVPQVVGKTQAQAEAALEEAGLAVGAVTKEYSDAVAKGKVIRTNPKEGTPQRADTAVRLVISKGPQPVDLPNVVGMESTAAQHKLLDLGLKPKVVKEVYSDKYDKGAITAQNPKSSTVDKGTTVELVVSKGPRLYAVPDVFGERTNDAVAILEKAGFKVDVQKIAGGIFNTVRYQTPGAGSMQPKGTTIVIKIV
jgi:serine/threonine-protein kinase